MHDSEDEGYDPLAKATEAETRSQRIRALNDRFRKTGEGGRHFATPGIQKMGIPAMLRLGQLIADYDRFSEDNDPYGEHDFGDLEFRGLKIFWKIDYYNETLTWGSRDPADPSITTRVLTIMLAKEY